MTPVPVAAEQMGVQGCECCGLVLAAGLSHCPRCRSALHARKPQSLQRTLAFLATAVVLYIPANVLPVMATHSVLGHEQHTLAGGIHDLWVSGSRELALIVFIASIAVPLLKIAALALLAFTAWRRSTWRLSPARWRARTWYWRRRWCASSLFTWCLRRFFGFFITCLISACQIRQKRLAAGRWSRTSAGWTRSGR